jgi:antitoxin component of MazEF toxin-antitoxin module
MVTTLTKHGDGLALVIDGAMLERLKIEADTPLEISTDGNRLIVVPADPQRRTAFEAALADTLAKYPNMLKRPGE